MIVYWEGACSVSGKTANEDISGQAYVELVGSHANQSDAATDLPALCRSLLKDLAASISKIAARAKDQVNRAHLEDVVARIERILDPRGGKSGTDAPPPPVAVERRPRS